MFALIMSSGRNGQARVTDPEREYSTARQPQGPGQWSRNVPTSPFTSSGSISSLPATNSMRLAAASAAAMWAAAHFGFSVLIPIKPRVSEGTGMHSGEALIALRSAFVPVAKPMDCRLTVKVLCAAEMKSNGKTLDHPTYMPAQNVAKNAARTSKPSGMARRIPCRRPFMALMGVPRSVRLRHYGTDAMQRWRRTCVFSSRRSCVHPRLLAGQRWLPHASSPTGLWLLMVMPIICLRRGDSCS